MGQMHRAAEGTHRIVQLEGGTEAKPLREGQRDGQDCDSYGK